MKKILVPILLLFLVSCSGTKYYYDQDPETDFSAFKTYSLYPWDMQNSRMINDFDKLTILGAIKDEMNSRGFKYVETNGELVVSTFVIIEHETSYQAYTDHYGGWAGYGGGWGYYGRPGYYGYGYGTGYSTTTVTSQEYNKGTLIIDVFSLENKQLIWQGIAKGTVQEDLDKRDKNLPVTIGKIFNSYPVKPLKSK